MSNAGNGVALRTQTNLTMKIGIFVTSLTPKGQSQASFQKALFEGLQRIRTDKYHFDVFSSEVPRQNDFGNGISFHHIEEDKALVRIAQVIKRKIGRRILAICKPLGRFGDYAREAVLVWMKDEPKYYKQLSKLNVRLFWNMNQHELRTPLPFIRTIWDVNHRIHSMYPEYSYTRYTFDGLDANLTQSLARASYVIVGTEEGKRQLVRMFGVHEAKVRVIPFPTPVLSIGDKCSQSVSEAIGRTQYLFYPARFWPHKNHVIILAAMKILHDIWGIKLHCIFSGGDEGNLGYVMRYAEKLGIADMVKYVGIVSEEDLSWLYRNALALVYASAVGPDNLPPLEAMSLNCPVIAAEVPGAREQYEDAALYFHPMREHELAKRIKELLESKMLREQLVSNGRVRAESWTTEDYAKRMISIFDEFALVARSWERCDSVFT